MSGLHRAGLIVVATFAGSLAAQESDPGKADIAKMQGEWAMVSGSADGVAMPAEMLASAKRVCKGNETKVTLGETIILQATFTVDPSKKPKTIDYMAIAGPTKGKRHLGIYEFDGETVRYCFAAPDAERPSDFTSKAGDLRTLSVWKRNK
jgi:uncharacterized protein (TIGR03067 family)